MKKVVEWLSADRFLTLRQIDELRRLEAKIGATRILMDRFSVGLEGTYGMVNSFMRRDPKYCYHKVVVSSNHYKEDIDVRSFYKKHHRASDCVRSWAKFFTDCARTHSKPLLALIRESL